MLFFEKVTFQMSPEGRLEESQGKRWRENILTVECGHWILVEPDLSYFNPKAWSNVGYFQICGRLLELRGGGQFEAGVRPIQIARTISMQMTNSVLSWFYSVNVLLSPDLGKSKLEGNFEVIWGSEIEKRLHLGWQLLLTGSVCLQFSLGKRADAWHIVVRLISDVCFMHGIGDLWQVLE